MMSKQGNKPTVFCETPEKKVNEFFSWQYSIPKYTYLKLIGKVNRDSRPFK